MSISMIFAKCFRASIQENICQRLFLKIDNFSFLDRFMSLEVQSCFNENGTSRKQERRSRQVEKNIAEREIFEGVAGKQIIPWLDVIQ